MARLKLAEAVQGRTGSRCVGADIYCWQCMRRVHQMHPRDNGRKTCCGLSRQSLSKILRSIYWGWFTFQRVCRCTAFHTPVNAIFTWVFVEAWALYGSLEFAYCHRKCNATASSNNYQCIILNLFGSILPTFCTIYDVYLIDFYLFSRKNTRFVIAFFPTVLT